MSISRFALLVIPALTGCNVGLSADGSHVDWGARPWLPPGPVPVAIQGDISLFHDIDTAASFESTGEDGWLTYEGDVVLDGERSVYVDITITNPNALPIGEELHAGIDEDELNGASISIYACPNEEGVSGSADDIFVTRLEEGDLIIGASAQSPEQNLDVAIQFRPAYSWRD